MKKIVKLFISLILITILSVFLLPIKDNVTTVSASIPYKTYTLDRYGDYVETQDAYEPYSSLKITFDSIEISDAQDMMFDSDDRLYIADSGNGRGLILSSAMEVITSFGSSEDLYYPQGIYVLDGTTEGTKYIYLTDYNTDTKIGRVLRYVFDVTTNEVILDHIFYTPSSWILDVDGYVYKPIKIAVSSNYYMYVTAEGSTSGVLMLTPENEFITYFASNSASYTFWEKVKYFFWGDNEQANLEKKIATPPYNIMLDGSGYVYTITQTSVNKNGTTDNFKKVNTGGVNYFPDEMVGAKNFTDSYFGKYSNTYALTDDGFIYEYDNEGNLLFRFAGTGFGLDVYGLFSSASTITVDSKDYIYVIDDTRNNLQIFKPTVYANLVHQALSLYTDAQYEEAEAIWNEVLRYNSMFDLAHKGVGLAYYMSGNYEDALDEFYTANDKEDYSDAYWEIRNLYLIDHLSGIMIGIILVVGLSIAASILDRKYHYMRKYVAYPFRQLGKVKFINQVFYMFNFIKHPSNTIYEIKTRRRSTVLSSSVLLILLFVFYILGLVYTGFIFNFTVIENTILVNEGIKVILPVILFIVSNYLMSSLMEGEGRFRDIFTSTIGSLVPCIIMYPFIIILSNVLTGSENFIYYFLYVVMGLWSFILLFVNIKETHNFSVGQTIVNLILTLFMVIILILVILIVYVMAYQVITFIGDIIKEAIINA